MLRSASELSRTVPACGQGGRPSSSSTFLGIARAMAGSVADNIGLWDETTGFFYDGARSPDGSSTSDCGCARWSALLLLLARGVGPVVGRRRMADSVTARRRWARAEHRPELLPGFWRARGPTATTCLVPCWTPSGLSPGAVANVRRAEFLSPLARQSGSACRRRNPRSYRPTSTGIR